MPLRPRARARCSGASLLIAALLGTATLFAASDARAQPSDPAGPYASVCFAQQPADLHVDLDRAGVALGHTHREKAAAGAQTCAVVYAAERARLDAAGVAYRVVESDLAAAYRADLPRRRAALQTARSRGFELERFDFGSLGGYYTFEEVVAKLDELHADFPDLITEKVSIGTTLEGRPIWMVEISNNPGVDEGEPEVLYTALHHAREPQSMATVLYFMVYLLEYYGTDPEVTHLVDNRRLTFVPVLNPDGYVYNEAIAPEGGGLWRKNRRDNGDGSFGVDPNRNYGYEWGFDDRGSSPDRDSQTYRGPGPFSEVETASLRDFIETRAFRAAFNYHSFSNLLIYPWGYRPGFYTPDSARFADYGRLMTAENGYLAGTADQTVGYIVNGSSDDWMYGAQTEKPKIYAFTPEVGSFEDYFWPSPERIEPLAQENLDANLLLAWVAGGFPDLRVQEVAEVALTCEPTSCGNGYIDPGDRLRVNVEVVNIGLEPLAGATVQLTATDTFAPLEGVSVPPLAPDAAATVTLEGYVAPDAPLGLASGLAVELEVVGVTRTVALPDVLIGTEVPLFTDAADNLEAWATEGNADWGLTTVAFSPPRAFADSPTRPYRSNTDAMLRLASPLDLSDLATPVLTFRTRWDIEATWDFAQVLVSTDGLRWEPVAGRYTALGSGRGVQDTGAPGYDGTQADWVQEQIDLSAWAGAPELYVAFQLRSDDSVQGDGWVVDDVSVSGLINIREVDAEDSPTSARLALGVPYPNPSEDGVSVPFVLPASDEARVEVYDVLGRRVAVLAEGVHPAGAHTLTWDGRDATGRALGAGTYVIRLVAAGQVLTRTAVRVP